MEERTEKKKGHREPHSGRKAVKKKSKKHNSTEGDAHKNPKAFTFNSAVKAARTFRRGQDIQSKKHHVPVVDRTPLEPPPILVAVVGPPKVGKSLLIQCLIKNFTRQPLAAIKGPVTVVSGKKRRITFMECNNDINSMIDLAKICDLVLLLIDASFGFEMEIFEFLNICQVHGMPKVMGVLTHLDILKQAEMVKKVKKTLKHRFWTEVYAGAKLFYLSGTLHGEYLRNEINNLGRFISVMKFRPLVWQTTHPYLLADRMEDLTSPELIRQNNKVDRCISLYGYMRGIPLNKKSYVHIPGCGDFHIKDVSYLPDPCPLPEKLKRRALGEKERLIYAPFSGVGDIVYDKDGVYIEVRNANNNTQNKASNVEPVKELVSSLLETKSTLDSKIAQSELQLFSNAAPITASEFVSDLPSSNSPDGINVKCVNDNGRERRKVIFSHDLNEDENNKMDVDNDDSDEDDDNMNEGSDDSDCDDNDDDKGLKNKIKKNNGILQNNSNEKINSDDDDDVKGNSGDDSVDEECEIEEEEEEEEEEDDDDDDDDDEEEDSGVKWKSNLAQKATDAYLERQATSVNLWKLVYGENNSITKAKQEGDEEDGDDEGEGLFKVVKQKEEQKLIEKDMMNAEDITARFSFTFKKPWTSTEICNSIKDCFVTGKWKKSEDAFRLTENGGGMDYDDDDGDDNDDDDICDGDFEDFETGEKHIAEKKEETTNESEHSGKKEVMTQKERLEKKKKLKERFNLQYDDDKEGDGKSYYDELKEEVSKQAEINRTHFEGLDDALRVQLEGFRAGLYVRIEFDSVPCELVNNFDPTYPVIVGSLQPGEENVGFIKARIKKHRWFERILKTNDPVIFSVGWRRFQTIPVYSKLEDNLRHRMLKYTPEHVACMVHFWGPLTRAGTGLLAVQDVASRQPGFRIVVTGTVVDTNQSTEITKKLKLTGVPFKIYKKTAFIQGMFNSTLEVAKFEGARIKTVSGIRGQIKKAVNKPEGGYRATFEDKLKLSDIVFCRTWFKVDIPKLYNPVTSLLLPISEKNTWQGMKTMWQLKKEYNVQNEPQKDSLYTEITRQRPSFAPFKVPKKLQKELPYRDKPKNRYHINKKKPKPERVAVVRDVQEAKVASLMSKLKSNYKAKVRQMKRDMEKRVKEHRKTVRLEEMKKQRRQKEEKRDMCKERTKKIARIEKNGGRNRRNEGDSSLT